jgi:regulator of sigma D
MLNISVTGHYEFEIKILTNGVTKTILRRFSDIEWLHNELLRLNPGCRIPDLPEKSVKFNSPFIKEEELKSRREAIQEYLNYIANHKYLSNNPAFVEFTKDNFKRNNSKAVNSIFSGISNLRSSMMTFINPNQNSNRKRSSSFDHKSELAKQRDHLKKLLHSLEDKQIGLIPNIVKQIF